MTRKEIFEEVLHRIENDQIHLSLSICMTLKYLFSESEITKEQYKDASKYFQSNKPTIFSKFYWSKAYKGYSYWWTMDNKGKQERIKFIKYLISKL
jgi:hypothetical protein